jgi:Spy/CpxP family protein refolding chaperone
MLRSILAGIALAAAPLAAQAQSSAGTPAAQAQAQPRHHHHHHRLFRGIKATSEQRAQLRAIRDKYAPQYKAARQNKDRATLRTLRQRQLDDVRGVLTPEQQKTFDANLAALRARHEGKGTKGTTAPSETPAPPAPAPQ